MDDKTLKSSKGFYIKFNINDTEIIFKFVKDDLTTQNTNIIVNAANNKLLFGGGIAEAIYKKAGYSINDECKAIMKNRNNKNLDNGEVIPTSCGAMQNENLLYVFHAVGPYYYGGERNEKLDLMLTFQSCLNLAESNEFMVESIAIPPISTGLFGYPIKDCAQIFFNCLTEFIKDKSTNVSKACLKDIRMCIIDSKTYDFFKDEFYTFLKEMQTEYSTFVIENGYIEFSLKNCHILKCNKQTLFAKG